MKKSIFVLALFGLCLGLASCEDPTKGGNGNNNVEPPTDSTSNVVTPTPNGAFSVSATQKVKFSQGNLRYTQSTDTWSFAEHQYDMLGEANVTADGNLADVIDLFGWSGSTGSAKWGVSISGEVADYSGEFVDWGKHIGNGTTWRTLTQDEWDYLLYTRTNARKLKGVARINLNADGSGYANGLILLPDNWTAPEGVTFKSGFSSEYNNVQAYADYQTFTLEEWNKLEAAGAVFLPASGARDGSRVLVVQNIGNYWSASPCHTSTAHYLNFRSDEANTYGDGRYYGLAVRLVQNF